MRKMTQEALEKLDDLLGFMQRSDWWTLDIDNATYTSYDFTKNDIARVRDALRKLPQVESIAMNGGWVLDCDNNWCKSGDRVRFFATAASEERTGELVFDADLYKWRVDNMDLGDIYEWHRI